MEMLFIKKVIESLGLIIKLPMVVYCDNIGAIFMATTKSTKGRTRHVDVKWHFIRELIDSEALKVEFVPTENNVADLFTKNLPADLYKRHSSILVSPVGEVTESMSLRVPIGEGVKDAPSKVGQTDEETIRAPKKVRFKEGSKKFEESG